MQHVNSTYGVRVVILVDLILLFFDELLVFVSQSLHGVLMRCAKVREALLRFLVHAEVIVQTEPHDVRLKVKSCVRLDTYIIVQFNFTYLLLESLRLQLQLLLLLVSALSCERSCCFALRQIGFELKLHVKKCDAANDEPAIVIRRDALDVPFALPACTRPFPCAARKSRYTVSPRTDRGPSSPSPPSLRKCS